MRGNPHSYQTIAATIPDPPDYAEDENGEVIYCDDLCGDGAVGQHGDQWYCARHLKWAYAWDHADEANDERFADGHV